MPVFSFVFLSKKHINIYSHVRKMDLHLVACSGYLSIQQLAITDKMAVTMETPWVLLLLKGPFVFAFLCCVNTVMVSLADNY